MVVGIDLRPLVSVKRSGVEEYLINLLEEILELDRKNSYLLFINSYRRPSLPPSLTKERENVEIVQTKVPNKLLNLSLKLLKYPKLDHWLKAHSVLKKKVDLFFEPNILFNSFSDEVGLVVVFHDLSFEHFPEFLNWKRKLWHRVINPALIAEEAKKIIAVSNFTRTDLLETYKLDAEKTLTIHSGLSRKGINVDKTKLLEVKRKYRLPENYFLCFGTLEPRKNLKTLIEAYLWLKNSTVKLVVAGAAGWKVAEALGYPKEFLQRKGIFFPGYIEPIDKDLLYTGAKFFVFPSFFEGFGFPLLEAAQNETPIIAAANSSIFEVIGRGALLVDPYNVFEMRQALAKMLNSADLRTKLKARAKKAIDRFEVETTALKTIKMFNKIYDEREKQPS